MAFAASLLLNLLVTVLIFKITTSTNPGTECTRPVCYQEKGFIEYRRGNTDRWTLRTSDNRFTTFVLLIKSDEKIDASNTFFPWLRITQHKYAFDRNHDVFTSGERLLVFQDTNQVKISLQRYDVSRFQVHFYVGCKVAEGDSTEITKESSVAEDPPVSRPQQPYLYAPSRPGLPNFYQYNPFSGVPRNLYVQQPPQPVVRNINSGYSSSTLNRPKTTCWIVIPTITEEFRTDEDRYYNSLGFYQPVRTRNVDVKRIYLTFQNVTMSNHTTLYATDMVTGSSLMTTVGDDKVSVATLNTNEHSSITYKPSLPVSSLILVDLKCGIEQDCEEAQFNFVAKALQESDVECIEREQKCRFNIGTKNFSCSGTPPAIPPSLYTHFFDVKESDLENSNCPAFNAFFQRIVGSVDSISAEDNSTSTDEEEGSGYEEDRETEIEGRRVNVNNQSRVQRKLRRCNNYPAYCRKPCRRFKRWGCSKLCYLFKMHLNICSYFYPSIFA